uniref:Interleukin-17 receptor C/E N-terminal domain-containing protein n=1 Tax=Monodelphis domestica TaxID=13616 RepID=F6YLD9_MONDO
AQSGWAHTWFQILLCSVTLGKSLNLCWSAFHPSCLRRELGSLSQLIPFSPLLNGELPEDRAGSSLLSHYLQSSAQCRIPEGSRGRAPLSGPDPGDGVRVPRFPLSPSSVTLPCLAQLQVHFDCFEVNVAQHVYVTLKTVPYYCEVQISREYHVEDCTNADVGRSIPACFAGGLHYAVDPAQKAIRVRFAEVSKGQAYYVRLCLKWFSCEDHSPPVLVLAEQPGAEVSLKYSRLLPCLCIEGWAAVPDAVRVQICPFENDTLVLWDYVVYNPFTGALSWEPPCPVQGHVHLCGMSEMGDKCWELSNTNRSIPGNVHYLQVDPQPWLCMKVSQWPAP